MPLCIAVSTIFVPSSVLAACGPGALGTERTISLDPHKVRSVSGRERILGLKPKEVILTFDDGPVPGRSTKILDALAAECVKATFFYVGKMARAYPDIVRRVIREGHTLAHHTQSHEKLPNHSNKRIRSTIQRGITSLEKAAYGARGKRMKVPYFRYPYLARNKRTDRVVRSLGLIHFGANIDGHDWKKVTPTAVHDRVMRRLRAEGKGIILLHDLQHKTAKIMPRLLRSMKREGYKIVHLVAPGSTAPDEPLLIAGGKTRSAIPPTRVTGGPTKTTPSGVKEIDMAAIDRMANAALAEQSKRNANRRSSTQKRQTAQAPKARSAKVLRVSEDAARRSALQLSQGNRVGRQGTPPPASKSPRIQNRPMPNVMVLRIPTVRDDAPASAKQKSYHKRFASLAAKSAFGSATRSAKRIKVPKPASRQGSKRAKPTLNVKGWKLRPSQWILR
ncbi:MAG: polysaccharide deacetylase family protein [Pseudomonadota bacterium]